mmetsp:Transcript_21224/g.21536  ORF Transcript_21224/g.21536 Transcript_21224/m.21536 type:complete len:172 (-) Transcript_21224:595-1110(-)
MYGSILVVHLFNHVKNDENKLETSHFLLRNIKQIKKISATRELPIFIMSISLSSPASWTTRDVETWATKVGLSTTTIITLAENEIDGPTLITLSKDDLKSELELNSLPARRYLWDLIENLKLEQFDADSSTAIQSHEEEIEQLDSLLMSRYQHKVPVPPGDEAVVVLHQHL